MAANYAAQAQITEFSRRMQSSGMKKVDVKHIESKKSSKIYFIDPFGW